MPFNAVEPTHFRLPDILSNWPWPRHLNPHYEVCQKESKAFNLCDFNLLASLGYPLHGKDGCRVGCELMNLFYVIDYYTDVANEAEAKVQADVLMDALRNPHMERPPSEWIGAEVARQFWLNALHIATPTFQRHFIDSFEMYMKAVVREVQDRTEHYIDGIEEFFDLRRDTCGVKPAFAMIEIELDIPDEVMQNEHIAAIILGGVDIIIVVNDMCSYNVEQARSDDHNLVAVVMRSLHLDLAGALEWISDLHDSIVEKFLLAFSQVPHYTDPKLDRQVTQFIHGIGNWVRANEVWSFESERYFGKRGREIQVTRMVELLPKAAP
ncbi:terpenoid synthase [Mycena maculata]|uniref:Terpene synthase n=1 Tax=Mycena maculata TaxID=230809 RepID=A0AAD7KF77_9AGAR|nr:terpenoid synthase [Mycena maculata]